MAMPRTWLPRAEEIIDVLRRMKSKQLDRPAIEELFQLQRRAAIELMTQAGAAKAKPGSPAMVDRTSLLDWAERIFKDEAWQLERSRTLRSELSRSMDEIRELRAALARQGKSTLPFTVKDEYLRASCASLPSAIRIEPSRIVIHIPPDHPETMITEACQLLYQLAMALGNDSEGFRDRLGADYVDTGLASLREMFDSLAHP